MISNFILFHVGIHNGSALEPTDTCFVTADTVFFCLFFGRDVWYLMPIIKADIQGRYMYILAIHWLWKIIEHIKKAIKLFKYLTFKDKTT